MEAKEIEMEVKSYEKMLKKRINFIFEQKIRDLSENLRNNIINGEILSGFIRL